MPTLLSFRHFEKNPEKVVGKYTPAERKRIEAGGIADFQRIVSQGITPSLLEWKGIEATEKLVVSPNTKVIVIGNGKDNLPVLLNGGN